MPNPGPRAVDTIGKLKRSVGGTVDPDATFPSCVDFGREVCCSLDAPCEREWLVTNGIGGFPFANHMGSYGLGSAGEIFDGDAPFTPRGCISQAWTVGELLRAWTACAAAMGRNRVEEERRVSR